MIRRLSLDIPRILIGLLFIVSGIDGLAWVLTGQNVINPPTSAAGLRFEDALKESGFIWPLMKVIDLVAGVMLLLNRAPAAALLLLLPIITVIILFHLVLNPGGVPIAIILAILTAMLLFGYRDRYAPLLR
jgi:putative oxidoreductase